VFDIEGIVDPVLSIAPITAVAALQLRG